jgi:hypothetical protein
LGEVACGDFPGKRRQIDQLFALLQVRLLKAFNRG